MTDMHEYQVGKPYIAGKTKYPENGEYNYRGGEHELRLFLADLTPAEINAVRLGRAEFGLFVDGPVILFLYRFGDGIPWSDAPYTVHVVPEIERQLPPVLEGPQRALLHVILVEANTGIIQVLRAVTFSPDFTRALHRAIFGQGTQPFDQAAYDRRLAQLYARHSTTELVRKATARCIGGE